MNEAALPHHGEERHRLERGAEMEDPSGRELVGSGEDRRQRFATLPDDIADIQVGDMGRVEVGKIGGHGLKIAAIIGGRCDGCLMRLRRR